MRRLAKANSGKIGKIITGARYLGCKLDSQTLAPSPITTKRAALSELNGKFFSIQMPAADGGSLSKLTAGNFRQNGGANSILS